MPSSYPWRRSQAWNPAGGILRLARAGNDASASAAAGNNLQRLGGAGLHRQILLVGGMYLQQKVSQQHLIRPVPTFLIRSIADPPMAKSTSASIFGFEKHYFV